MVHIIGVDHLVQYNGPVPEEYLKDFKTYLKNSALSVAATLIAEEFSREALHDVYEASEGTAEMVARELNIEHRYCDPEEKDRNRLGIPYYADIRDRVKKRYDIVETFILDNTLRDKVESETAAEARRFWPLRELFWYDRIADRINDPIIFICGHEHVTTMMSILEKKTKQCMVMEKFWREDIFSNYSTLGLG